jgi:hypothetical protein
MAEKGSPDFMYVMEGMHLPERLVTTLLLMCICQLQVCSERDISSRKTGYL